MQNKKPKFARMKTRTHRMRETEEARNRREQIQRTLGQRVRELRLKQGLAQEEFADVCAIHRSHMGQIERGETNLTLETILTLAHGLKITVHELLKGVA